MKNIKKRLPHGEALNGCCLSQGSSLTAETIDNAGFDWVLVDLEHGSDNIKEGFLQLQALQSATSGVILRVKSNDRRRIQRVSNMGAEGIMFFQNKNAVDAKKTETGAATRAVKAVRILLFDSEDYQSYHDMGIRPMAYSSDATFVAQGAKNIIKALNSKKN